jgi:hypothetical protein
MASPSQSGGGLVVCASVLLMPVSSFAASCEPPAIVREADPDDVHDFFVDRNMSVLTLLGYSGVGYEDEAATLAHLARLLDQADPRATIVNIGATAAGIGAAYEIAKQKGFTTSGIVSTQARESGATLSPCVDIIFYVTDTAWGGLVEKTGQLSPTSTAMVGASNRMVAIGGGTVSRDEFMAAMRLGKPVHFVPADMNHALAQQAASSNGQPRPTDFLGALGEILSRVRSPQ